MSVRRQWLGSANTVTVHTHSRAIPLPTSGFRLPSPSAVIFDMDGLLIDSEPLWRIAEVEALAAVGVSITEEDALETTGLRTDEVVELWHGRYPWAAPPKKEIEARIISRLIALVRERGEPMAGAKETLEAFSAAGYPLAIASSSASEIIAAVLETLGIGGYFRVTQSAEHEPFGKPHPGVYIEAARALGVEPRTCLAFEDSPNGVIAAKAARMTCVAVPDPALAGDRRFGAADLVLGSLAEFRMEMVVRP
jgi:mannitol-1-/sugar-/sorbitol-6-/2-deoxyglucose-6-phosphatase